jgi:hypothetical protein
LGNTSPSQSDYIEEGNETAHGQWEEPDDIHNTNAILSDEEADKVSSASPNGPPGTGHGVIIGGVGRGGESLQRTLPMILPSAENIEYEPPVLCPSGHHTVAWAADKIDNFGSVLATTLEPQSN